MENLGGNCVQTMAQTFDTIDHDRPTCFLAYTVKGWGTPIAGHKDNHGGLMNNTQFAQWQKHMGVAAGDEWEPLATVKNPAALRDFLSKVSFFAKGTRRYHDDKLAVPAIDIDTSREISTRWPLAKFWMICRRGDSDLAARIVTTSPDVTGTTNLGPWVNRRKLFARSRQADALSNTASPRPRNGNSRRKVSISS